MLAESCDVPGAAKAMLTEPAHKTLLQDAQGKATVSRHTQGCTRALAGHCAACIAASCANIAMLSMQLLKCKAELQS